MKNSLGNKSCLKLQSYKLDSHILVEKMNELNGLKQELQSTIIKRRTEEHSMIDELSIIKSENKRLKQEVSTLKFTNKAQENLIQKLEERLQEIKNKQGLFLQQIQNKSIQKSQLQMHYKERISLLRNSQDLMRQSFRQQIEQITKSLKQDSSQHQNLQHSISSSNVEAQKVSARVIKRLKKPSILQPEFRHRQSISVEEKYRSKNAIVQRQQDSFLSGEDIYLQAVRQLYKQLMKIGIKARDMLKIPQICAFSKIHEASRTDFRHLFTQHPFKLKQPSKIDLVFDFFSNQSQRTKHSLTGKYVVAQIIQAIEEIEENNSVFSCSKVDLGKSLRSTQKENGYYSPHGNSFNNGQRKGNNLRQSKAQSAKISIDKSLRSESSLYF